MSGNKAMRRAAETNDAIRIGTNLPLIVDRTELITPEIAREYLKQNKRNRPINWRKVEEYAAIMKNGKWELHSQGIVFDSTGNILTGQKRLWAVVYADVNVYFRVSRGSHPSTAKLLDRGTPQSARDLASRDTERKHSPTESSIARAIAVLKGNVRPSVDDLATIISDYSYRIGAILKTIHGTKKTRDVLMIAACVAESTFDAEGAEKKILRVTFYTEQLKLALHPETAVSCWGKGAAFSLAMAVAWKIVSEQEK